MNQINFTKFYIICIMFVKQRGIMMKKKICLVLSGLLVFSLVGCSSSNKETSNKEPSNKKEQAKEKTSNTDKKKAEESKIKELGANEWFTVNTDEGSYKFTVREVNYLAATEYREAVIQLVYEYENIDFKSSGNINGIKYKDINYLPSELIKAVDNQGYVLSQYGTYWDDEHQEAIPIKAGEKCIVKTTYKLNSTDINSIKVSFDRLDEENTVYIVPINR